MQLTEELQEKCRIVAISGRLDTNSYAVLEGRLMDLIGAGETRFVADCAAMDYVSSSGLRVFLMVLKKLRAQKGRFVLCSLNDRIREVFAISGFSGIFEVYPDRAAALASF
jgi:anti-anti-sigma factor